MNCERLVIIGAGPVGLEAALRGVRAGYDVAVLEQGQVGQAVQSWGHVELFTPFGMNSSSIGREAVGSATTLPNDDAILSGAEYCCQYLQPLSECPELKGRVFEHHKLLAAGRSTLSKADQIGRPSRAEQPFRLLIETPTGQENRFADILIDCTGFLGKHCWIGAGGIPCPGETECLTPDCYVIPNVSSDISSNVSGQTIAVIGSGYSAATTVVSLAGLPSTESAEKIFWITRGDRIKPIAEVANDLLPQRRHLTVQANEFVMSSEGLVNWIPGAVVDGLSKSGSKYQLQLTWPNEGRAEVLNVDRVIANAGYRPNTSPFEELQIHRCYATEGPIKMAAHLLGEGSGDCLKQSARRCFAAF